MFGQPVLAPWQLHALEQVSEASSSCGRWGLCRRRLHGTCRRSPRPGKHSARRARVKPPHGSGRRRLRPAQAWATPRTLSSARLVDAEDYVDAVYMVLAAADRTHASAALCSATHACAGKTFSEAGSWQTSCFRRRHVLGTRSRVPPRMEP